MDEMATRLFEFWNKRKNSVASKLKELNFSLVPSCLVFGISTYWATTKNLTTTLCVFQSQFLSEQILNMYLQYHRLTILCKHCHFIGWRMWKQISHPFFNATLSVKQRRFHENVLSLQCRRNPQISLSLQNHLFILWPASLLSQSKHILKRNVSFVMNIAFLVIQR